MRGERIHKQIIKLVVYRYKSKQKVKNFFLNFEKIRMSVGPILILHRVPKPRFGRPNPGSGPPYPYAVYLIR